LQEKARMSILSAQNISKQFADKELFNSLDFAINKGEKIAVIGQNGAGKSTLMRILAQQVVPDSGQVVSQEGLKLVYLPQQPIFDPQATIRSYMMGQSDQRLALLHQYENALAEGSDAIGDLIEEMNRLDVWSLEAKIAEVVAKLGLPDLDTLIAPLSGGQKRRIALAAVLLAEADLVILDEPTNHLDLPVIEWLENYLNRQNLSILLVTHDRYFLEKVTNSIAELENGKLFKFQGNYAAFLEAKEAMQVAQQAETEKNWNTYRRELEWVRRQPKARGTKAKYRVDAFDELNEKLHQKQEKINVEFAFNTARQGRKVMEIRDISKSFADKHLFDSFTYTFKPGDKIGLIGKNGTGKSTFINIITGAISPDNGEIEVGQTVVFGHYKQAEPVFPAEMKVIDVLQQHAEVVKMADGSELTASSMLTRFGFAYKKQYEQANLLSGGQKRRLQLLEVLIKQPNFLILDEPTNDLDIFTISKLEQYLQGYQGTLVIASHDRCFMDTLVDHLFVFGQGQQIIDFQGNYTDFREMQAQAAKTAPVAPKNLASPKEEKKQVADNIKKKRSFKEQKEFETLEAQIESLNQEKALLEQQLTTQSDTLDYQSINGISVKIEQINAALDQAELRWLELAEIEN